MNKIYYYDYWLNESDIDLFMVETELSKVVKVIYKDNKDLKEIAENLTKQIIDEAVKHKWLNTCEGIVLFVALKERGKQKVNLFEVSNTMRPLYTARTMPLK